MSFDVRLPIGLLFLVIGGLLAAYGFIGDPAVLELHSPGLNIDLIWGSVLAAFGSGMLLMAVLAKRNQNPPKG